MKCNTSKRYYRVVWAFALSFALIFAALPGINVYATGQLAQVDIAAGTYGLTVGQTVQLTVTGTLDDGFQADLSGATISYSSSNTAIAAVSSTGLVQGNALGVASITANVTLDSVTKSRSICVVVNSSTIFSDGFESGLSNWAVLYGYPLISSYQKHSQDFGLNITKDCEVVTKQLDMAYNGVLQVWFYDDSSSNKECVINTGIVVGPITSVSGSNYVIKYGSTPTYITTGITRSKGWHQVVMDYTTQNNVILYIDGILAGQVSGYEDFNSVSMGDYWTDHLYSRMYFDDITVYRVNNPLGKITATSPAFNLKVGQTSQLSLSGTMEDGTSANLSTATKSYSSSNTSVATVNSSGLVTAIAAGSAVITATVTLNGVTKSTTYNMKIFSTGITLNRLDLSGSMSGLKPGDTSQLLVNGVLSDGSIADLKGFSGNTFTFTSSNTGVATVSASGLVTAIATGVANITVSATMEGVTKSRRISIIVNKGILFNEGFEAGLSSWTISSGSPATSTTQKRNGASSLKLPTDSAILYKTFDRSLNDIFEVWFYDDGATQKEAVFSVGTVIVGPIDDISTTYYVVRYGSPAVYITTTIARDVGWHQVVYDFTGSNTANVYIDGVSAAQLSGYENFNSINIGDYWTDSCISNMYVDDISVYTLSNDSAKTVATYYTQDNVTTARQNANTYAWADAIRDAAAAKANTYLALGDDGLWDLITTQNLARGYAVNQSLGCPVCGTAISSYGNYPWLIDQIGDPWKLECPSCQSKFPTNDFGAYYRSGLDNHGNFDRSMADSSLLVNTLDPSKGSTWGVDDGTGWVDSSGNKWTFIAYYNHWGAWYSSGIIQNALQSLRDAYLYTGDNKYAHAGIILLDRIADVYPSMNTEAYPVSEGYLNSDGGIGHGKIIGCIWETILAKEFASAYDAFFPALTSSDGANVVPFLNSKAKLIKLANTKDSISAVKRNMEDNILRVIYPACLNAQIYGNSGMHQSALAMAAVVLDEAGTSNTWIDWIFKTGELLSTPDWNVTGGDINNTLINRVDRDGYGDEASPDYNNLWVDNIKVVADVLKGYYRYPEYNLYDNVKFRKLLTTNYSLMMLDKYTPPTGDSGQTGKPGFVTYLNNAVDAYDNIRNPQFAQYAYFLNGKMSNGLHGSIFSTNPEQIASDIQSDVSQYGELDLGCTDSAGYGFAALRDGINYIRNYGIRYAFMQMSIVDSSGRSCSTFNNSRTLQYNATAVGDYINFAFNVPTANQYELDLQSFKASSYGKYGVYIDQQYIGEYDFYGVGGSSYQESIGNMQLTAGDHQIKFICTGKNVNSSGYSAGLIELALLDQQAQADKSIALQNGNKQRGATIYYGRNTGHGHKDTLNMELYAFGLNLSPDHGYPEFTGADPMRLEWTSNTSSHNTIMVDEEKQADEYTGITKHLEESDSISFIDVEASEVYPQTDLYRRSVATVKVDDTNSYTLEIFRVKGGRDHHYIFHGPEGTITTEGLNLVPQTTGTYAGTDVDYAECVDDDDPSEWIYNGSGFHYLYNVQRDDNDPSDFDVDWDVTDTWSALPQPADVHLRMHFLNAPQDLAIADGNPPQNKPGNPESLKYVIGHRSGSNLVSQFANIFEPYIGQRFIQSIEKVSIITEQQGVSASDAYAVKVTLTNGRVDYVMNALDPTVLYKVDDRFDFKGSLGLYSEQNGLMVNAYLADGTYLGENGVQYNTNIYNALTGTVSSFTTALSNDNQITLNLSQSYSDINDLVGRYVYVTSDGARTAVYRIKEIKSINGNIVTFGIGDTTFIRGYVDNNDFTLGYTYDIQNGASFRIPLAQEILPEFSIDLSGSNTGLVTGNTSQLSVIGIMSDGSTVDLAADPDAVKTYTSDNTSVATVSSTGLVTAVSTGLANITVNVTKDGVTKSKLLSIIVYGSRPFNDGFESGLANWSVYGTVSASQEMVRTGSYSCEIESDMAYLTKNLGSSHDGFAELWLYDNGSTDKECISNVGGVIAGPYCSQSDSYYVVRYGTPLTYIVTQVHREQGWHQIVYDYTAGNIVKVYIDGTLGAEINGYDTFNSITIGDIWSDSWLSGVYFDDVSVYIP